ncbi:MAG: uroporphyrinogen decarboxylase family protein [Clostridiales bacterium]|jgi:hypothetical protein|nr:uroporphyrinogen-III decarboxylase [Eubacteriales bacterium]MDH7565878.1 uroporphyrinogen decarboxylase family protein [Clostridiales bacterium]
MKTGQPLYDQHLQRILDVVAMKKTDRPPVVLNASAFCLKLAGGKLSDMVTDVEYGNDLVLKGMLALGDIDGTEVAVDYPPALSMMYLSPIKLPGRELPEDTIWQVDERGMMTEEDYDTIINKGWDYFFIEFCKNRLGNLLDQMENFAQLAPRIVRKFTDAGIVYLTPTLALLPFETLSGGRSMAKFNRDLHRMPDKVQAVMDIILEETVQHLKGYIHNMNAFAVSIGAARVAGNFLSLKDFNRFAWPYLKKLVEITVQEGAVAYLHLDLSWDRFLNYFLELPKGKCIFSTDSTTDIFKAKEVLQGHMCFTGDVPPTLLTLATPDQVYKYSKRLVDEFAPIGFIMSSGCTTPYNAKPENVRAMISAALGK